MSSSGILYVAAPEFEATGFISGSMFQGLSRQRNLGADSTYEVLTFRLLETDSIVAFFSDLSGRVVRRDVWRSVTTDERDRSSIAREPRRAIASRNDSLPAFGEYVYADELPEAIHMVMPETPEATSLPEGTVMVQALIGADGLVKDARVVKSVPLLDDAAVAAVRQWRFKPAYKNGSPVAVWVAVPMHFSLH